VYTRNRADLGYVKGEPRRFVPTHGGSKRWVNHPPQYVEQPGPLSTPCWIWQRTVQNTGYGELVRDGRKWLAHVWFYFRATGRLMPKNHVLHHRCGNKLCVNPRHVKPLTRGDHLTRHTIARLLGIPA
jgi:hypothetical protein